jgi:hypothetical protein
LKLVGGNKEDIQLTKKQYVHTTAIVTFNKTTTATTLVAAIMTPTAKARGTNLKILGNI